MDRLATQPRPARARKSLWTRDDGSVIDRTAPSGRWAPREEVPRLWAGCRDRLGDGCYQFKAKLEPDGVPPLFAEAERRRAQRAKKKAECGCEGRGPVQSRSTRPEAGGGPRRVEGRWLAAVARLDAADAARIADQTVELEDAAWHAVRALLEAPPSVQRVHDRIARRRARIWSHHGEHVDSAAPTRSKGAKGPAWLESPPPRGSVNVDLPFDRGVGSACGCASLKSVTARYVDAEKGDDGNSGRLELFPAPLGTVRVVLRPWKTLGKVQDWLNTDVYGTADPATTALLGAWVFLRRGVTWDGTEDGGTGSWSSAALGSDTYGDQAALFITGAKGAGGTGSAPTTRVMLSSYGDSADPLPVIDGSEGGPPQYQDQRIGVLVRDCCRFGISNIDVRGFGTGIDVRGACSDHVYSGLTLREHGITGIRIGVREPDIDAYAVEFTLSEEEAAYYMAYGGTGYPDRYPDEIKVYGCTFSSIGYDTEGADVALNYLATNCTISENDMSGDADRGIDGVVSQLGSSGHLIEGNTIHEHNKYCYTGGTDKAVLASSTACGTTPAYVLYQSCEASISCLDSGFNYWIQSYSSGFALPAGEEAFGEDGIDLKCVRERTSRSADTTVIRANVIYGQTVAKKTGITISDGTVGVHIYNNRIFLNSVGIFVTNTKNDSDHYGSTALTTSQVYIYRNLVYMNLEEGILVKSQEDGGVDYGVDGVYIINNTIAHNMYTGVLIANGTDSSATELEPGETKPDVDHIYLYNNLIARNGIGGNYDNESSNAASMQVAWSGKIALTSGVITFGSDYNCYLGWEREREPSDSDERVIGIGEGVAFDPLSLADAETTWRIESGPGVQATTIDELYLQDGATMAGYETLLDIGDSFKGFLEGLTPSALGGIDALDYSPIDASSPCVDAAWDGTGVLYDGTADDVAVSPDFAGNPNTGDAPDIGALELI